MPKVVEHDRRRTEIADAALALLARDGTRAVTIRAVAHEAGWSAGALNHYFGSRHELLVGMLRRAAELQGRVFEEIQAEPGLAAMDRLRATVESVLPLDERRVAMTKIFLIFYAEATLDTDARAEVGEYLGGWRRVVRREIRAAKKDGALPDDLDTKRLAAELVALVDGLAVHAVLDPAVLGALAVEGGVGLSLVEGTWRLSPGSEEFGSALR